MICRNKDKGFTFIELILYMAILGIFMVAVMSLISTTVASHKKQSSRQKLQSQATETYDAIADILMGQVISRLMELLTYRLEHHSLRLQEALLFLRIRM